NARLVVVSPAHALGHPGSPTGRSAVALEGLVRPDEIPVPAAWLPRVRETARPPAFPCRSSVVGVLASGVRLRSVAQRGVREELRLETQVAGRQRWMGAAVWTLAALQVHGVRW